MKRRDFIKSIPAVIAGFFVAKKIEPLPERQKVWNGLFMHEKQYENLVENKIIPDTFDSAFLQQLRNDCHSGRIKTIDMKRHLSEIKKIMNTERTFDIKKSDNNE